MAHLALSADVPGCGNGNSGGPGCPPCDESSGGPNPFHVATGNAYRAITDLEVWGGVGEHQLVFQRYGISRHVGSLKWFGEGHTWRHSYQWELVNDGTRALKVYKPDGSQWRYVLTVGQWTRLAGTPDRLTQNGSDFILQTDDGYRYRFRTFTDANGGVYYLLIDFTDSEGNLYTLTYDESRRLVQVTEPAGRYLRITYSNIPVNQNAFTRLGTITTHPASGQWTEMAVSNPSTFRYLRYFSSQPSSNETFCNNAEMEFYDTAGNKLTGTPFGTSPAYAPGSEFDKASDGSVDTFFQ
ncbi:MAG TPA: DUF6531 domain-containing protein [Chthoniobacterales bacterium]